MLLAIKLAHTAIWALFAGCVVALPVAAWRRRFRWAALLSAAVLLECVVLACNGGRCPLTDLAARYTADRRPNFDILLPAWLALYNKVIFGALFLGGEILFLARWAWSHSRLS